MVNDLRPDPRLDFTPLEPDASDAAGERFVDGVMKRVHQVAPPRIAADPLWGIWSMSRGLAAAALAIGVLLATLYLWDARRRGPSSVIEALGIPPDMAQLIIESGGR